MTDKKLKYLKCFCADWNDNIEKFHSSFVDNQYHGSAFSHCPWCGGQLAIDYVYAKSTDNHGYSCCALCEEKFEIGDFCKQISGKLVCEKCSNKFCDQQA